MEQKTKIIIGIIIAVVIILFLIFVYPGKLISFNGNATFSPATCSDSDGGLNYYVNGTVTAKNLGITKKYRDVCINSTTLKEMYCVIRKSDSIPDNKIYFCPGGCAGGKCLGDDLSDVPYSFLAVHEEGSFESVQELVDLANQYHVPLTIMFWPGEVDYILEDQSRIDSVHRWQAEGHEIGLHDQGCWDGSECWNGSTLPECDYKYYHASSVQIPGNAEKYERLVAPYKIKSATSDCLKWDPKSIVYEGAGRPDGRNSVANKRYESDLNQDIYSLYMKAGFSPILDPICGGADEKIAQYSTLHSNEIMGVVFHTSDYTGNPDDPSYIPDKNQLIKYLKFLYEKDPVGKKRKTMSDLMENYVLPNNLTIEDYWPAESSNKLVKACSYILYENIPAYSTTNLFNFGRCLQIGTYCAYEGDDRIQLDKGIYCPHQCIIKNVSEFDKSRSLAINCGDENCDFGEEKICPSDCPAGSKS